MMLVIFALKKQALMLYLDCLLLICLLMQLLKELLSLLIMVVVNQMLQWLFVLFMSWLTIVLHLLLLQLSIKSIV